MSKRRGNPETALNQVAHTEHPDEALEKIPSLDILLTITTVSLETQAWKSPYPPPKKNSKQNQLPWEILIGTV